MTITIDATYEDGVLKPSQPLPFDEHAQVRVTVEPQIETAKPPADEHANNEEPLWEQILSLTRDLPPEAFEGLPTDGASQHDHYIYGTPKRTDLRDTPE
jgi:predicted DNA-binding antitoxin AbrB/MazE fold protein